MVRFLLAVVAALSALQALNAMSLDLEEDLQPLEAHRIRLDKRWPQTVTTLDLEDDDDSSEEDELQSLEPQLERGWPQNATDILEKIEAVLAFIEKKIDDMTVAVEDAIKSALDVMEEVANDQAARWNTMVQDWEDRAHAAGVDIKECLAQQESLAVEIEGLRKDARACTDKQVAAVRAALADVTRLRAVAQRLVADTAAMLQACLAEESPVFATLCLVQRSPPLAVRAARLGVDATLLSGRVGAKAAAIGPLASLCASKAAAGRAATATRIIDSTVKCIRTKLGQ